MKAAFIVDNEKVELKDTKDPLLPDDGLILKIEACGVCGSDLRRWREGPGENQPETIAGHEISGSVIAVGKDHKTFSIGERLALAPDVHCGECYYCRHGLFNLCDNIRLIGITPEFHGGFAEKMAISQNIIRNGIVHRIPDTMEYDQAALAEPSSSVLAAHEKANTSIVDTVVVLGAGPIGCLHVAISQARGARVIVSEPSLDRRNMAARFNPIAIIDPTKQDLKELVRSMTDGVGADIVICANPVATTQTLAVEIVRKAGRVILFGGLPKQAPMTTLNANVIHYGDIEVVGSFSYHPSTHNAALKLIDQKVIDSALLITHSIPLAEIGHAFEIVASGKALKVIINP